MSVNALAVAGTMAVIEGNKEDIAAQGEQIGRHNADIKKNGDASSDITRQMRDVEQDAVDMQEKADDTKWPARIFRTAKRREKKAQKLTVEATELSGDAEKIDMKSERARTEIEDDLEVMKSKNESITKAVEYVGKFASQQSGINL